MKQINGQKSFKKQRGALLARHGKCREDEGSPGRFPPRKW